MFIYFIPLNIFFILPACKDPKCLNVLNVLNFTFGVLTRVCVCVCARYLLYLFHLIYPLLYFFLL